MQRTHLKNGGFLQSKHRLLHDHVMLDKSKQPGSKKSICAQRLFLTGFAHGFQITVPQWQCNLQLTSTIFKKLLWVYELHLQRSEKPSCPHTTLASRLSQKSSATVPHIPPIHTSTRPSEGTVPFNSLISPWVQLSVVENTDIHNSTHAFKNTYTVEEF